jgi:hypothetical protein
MRGLAGAGPPVVVARRAPASSLDGIGGDLRSRRPMIKALGDHDLGDPNLRDLGLA